MSLHLQDIPPERYAEQILPLTEPLWGRGRPLNVYREQTTAIAGTTYGRKSYRTVGLWDGGEILASFKRYEREARTGNEHLRAMGIGAVFTPEHRRGRGFASSMLAMALDDARASKVDFAFLFSDIHPQFYKEIGFIELPSRTISFRADSLPASRIDAQPIGERDWPRVRACFDAMESQRRCALVRTPAVWNWIRTHMTHLAAQAQGQPVDLAVRRGNSIAAYLIGRRKPLQDSYVVDEAAARDEHARELLPGLLRAAAGDLRRIAGWLPPAPVRGALPRGAVRRRSEAIWMIAPLTRGGARFVQCVQHGTAADGIWALDHI